MTILICIVLWLLGAGGTWIVAMRVTCGEAFLALPISLIAWPIYLPLVLLFADP
jgi:hypothetical protein